MLSHLTLYCPHATVRSGTSETHDADAHTAALNLDFMTEELAFDEVSRQCGSRRQQEILMTETTQVPLYNAREGFGPTSEVMELRESGELAKVPVTLGSGEAWLVTRYEDVRRVLSDHAVFSNAVGLAGFAPEGMSEQDRDRLAEGQLLALDPPEHTTLRRYLTPEFTMRRMRALQPRITEMVDEHLDLLERTGPGADLMTHFALPIPSLAICELLGVSYADRTEFQERSARSIDITNPPATRTKAAIELRAFMADLVARAQADPGDDLLGTLIREHGNDLSTNALVNIAAGLLSAGHETTAGFLAIATYALLTHPDQLAWLRDNLTQIDQATEELLRFLSVAHSGIARVATQDVEIGGQTIHAGDQVLFALAPANRDPRFIDDGDRLDLTRKPVSHMAFGHGPHHCVGAPLARTEIRIAIPALLRRFPNLALAVPAEDIRFRTNSSVYSVEGLPVTW